jgi:quinol-cytochrome oxidoreductase complex cytochrome b subunit
VFESLLGLFVVFIIVAAVLAYFEVIDLFELLGAVVKLIAALLFAIGAFFVWLVKRSRQEGKS